ncbi:hypothetical protein JG687_00015821 [Phytophthora cactorum]|uniref:Uncharacterized protein n=1 Tax=Phytophthora cactorum TaxID=29920 RepID=A0A8T1TTW5_9STRA|nr:hypothetical protein JG687_00015821 [Phytophthora cactorum]
MIISLWTGHEIHDKDRTMHLVKCLENCAPTDGNNRASFTAPIWRRVHRVRLGLETTMADNELGLHNGAVGPTKPGSELRSGNLGRSEHEGAPSNIVPPASGAGQKGNVYIYIPNYKALCLEMLEVSPRELPLKKVDYVLPPRSQETPALITWLRTLHTSCKHIVSLSGSQVLWKHLTKGRN